MRCKQGDLAVIVQHCAIDDIPANEFVGIFMTCGPYELGPLGELAWRIVNPSRPLKVRKGTKTTTGTHIADCCLQPIRGTDKTIKTDKTKELEAV